MVKVDIIKARDIAHSIRRSKRDNEFISIDGNIVNVVVTDTAESDRVALRTKYASMQNDIDAASTTEELNTIINE